jgi:DtxR family Mn-dependent transcriptional regulator
MNDEIIIQDTLKYIAESEYGDGTATPAVLAANLGISIDQVEGVLNDLESASLIEHEGLRLTPTGREYALHVLRAHRLYETYLARKTGVRESQWHTQAHIKEHTLSVKDVEQLARDLDYPLFDPHGDPIPSATGSMPPQRGQALTDHPVGWAGRVIHIEDEPIKLYSLIVAASIAPGTVLRIQKKEDKELEILAEGHVFRFPLEAAGQLTVEALTEDESFDTSIERLSALALGEKAVVVRLSPLCRGLERNRLLDLGMVPGSVLSVDLVSPSGSPIAYRVRGASIALRREQAERILIRKNGEDHDE